MKRVIFFIHDFSLRQNILDAGHRSDYTKVLDFLEIVDSNHSMFKFKKKKL